ncbi:MAG TPA: type II secretion system F family protein [Nitrospirae bacterium]|nr:type II secretion system F family protein [Nitrospirota bacterium]
MPYYRYKAVNTSGESVAGLIESASPEDVEGFISNAGFYPLKIKETNPRVASLLKTLSARRIKRKDLIEFANNLSVMLKAGIPLLSCLEDLSVHNENRYFREKIQILYNMIQMGSTFSDALSLHRDVFPDIFIRLVAVGEETGRLDMSLKNIAEHLERMESLASAIKRALIYPVFAIVTTFGAMLFWLIYVLPKIISLFREMEISLPLMTRILIKMSDFTVNYWYIIIGLPVVVFLLWKWSRRYKRIRYKQDSIKLKAPIIRLIVQNKLLGLFSEQMRILLMAGLTIDRILDLLADVIDNEVMKDAIHRARDDIMAGESIADALRKHPVFPMLLIRMVHVGEQTGNLDDQFNFLSVHFLERLDDVTQKIGRMLEPIIIVFIGLFFVLILLGLLFPVYDLISKVR